MFRPQFHYSPPTGWANDPDGLVYYNGEYHLFYQYVVDSRHVGPEHWAHAVSSDLIHWTNLPIALYPDHLGTTWSGSVVVDAHNTTVLSPAVVWWLSIPIKIKAKGLPVSTTGAPGRSTENPVIPVGGKDFRDPSVFWRAGEQKSILALAAGRAIKILASPDLLGFWSQVSEFRDPHVPGAIFECPNLFPMQFEGQTKWVLTISIWGAGPLDAHGTIYLIGHFDGKSFTIETRVPRWLN